MAARYLGSPRALLVRAWIWVGVCLLWVGILIRRIVILRATGRVVGTTDYFEAALWGAVLMFWLWNVARAHRNKSLSEEQTGKVV